MEISAHIQSILITNGIGFVLLLGLLVLSQLTRERRNIGDRIFTVLIFVCMGSCICESATWIADGTAQPWAFTVNYFGNTYCYLATSLYAYLWVLYVDLRLYRESSRIRHRFPVLLAVVAVMWVAIIGNLFGHYLFTIDENNVYSRQPLSYINYVLTFSMLFYSVWLRHKARREMGTIRFFPISMFIVPIFIGAGLQALMFGVSLAWVSVCIGLVNIHMSQQNELSYLDSLTDLYNRPYLDYALKTMSRSGQVNGGIMIDMDFFKSINDTYGHSAGDRALRHAADILTSCAPEGSVVIRYAGDEFIMLVKADDEAELKRVEGVIRERVGEFNESGVEPYNLALSMGSSLYVPGQDTADSFLSRIDARMYEDKRTNHEAIRHAASS